jgi:hypothetical protein
VANDYLQSRADALAARVQALAAALHASGVSDETSERLLAQASAAALQALTLELLLERREPPSSGPVAEEPRREPSLPLAA